MENCLTDKFSISDQEFQQLSDLVYKHCGINLHMGKKTLVRARLAKWIHQGHFNSFREYIDHVLSDSTGHKFSNLIDTLSTNVTSFFREEKHFHFLRNKFLPNLLERKKQDGNSKIRGWSAGCSSGEEPHSIGITLLEALGGSGRWDLKILATDISTRMLEKARQGIYEMNRINGISPEHLQKYFITTHLKDQLAYQANNQLKSVLMFHYLNLMEAWPIKGPVDFIFCRNVMIYFDKETQQDLVRRYWNLLEPGGILFTGHSESLTGIEHQFCYVQPTIYKK